MGAQATVPFHHPQQGTADSISVEIVMERNIYLSYKVTAQCGQRCSDNKAVQATSLLCHGNTGQKDGQHRKYAPVAKQRSMPPRNYRSGYNFY